MQNIFILSGKESFYYPEKKKYVSEFFIRKRLKIKLLCYLVFIKKLFIQILNIRLPIWKIIISKNNKQDSHSCHENIRFKIYKKNLHLNI